MVSPVTEAIAEKLNARLSRLLDTAAVGIKGKRQFLAFRKVVLDEFGRQGFLPELDALLKQHGMVRKGQADIAGKEVRHD